MTPAIVLRGVERRFGTTRVLDGIDLQIDEGDRVALLGANGAGKTTLIRVLAGLLRPNEGEVRIFGSSPHDDATRARIGLLGHAPSVYPRLSALENLRFWGGLYGVANARERGTALLTLMDLDPDDRRPVSTYSQGMRRRVGLACAFLHDPPVLLLDEPYAGLDRSGAAALEALLEADSRTVLLATHEPERARRIAGRMVTLRDGRLNDEGRP